MSRVTRTTRRSLPTGLWGTLLFIATEATLFGTLIATYFYLRFQNPAWPPQGTPKPEVALPLALTGALVLSAVPMFIAVRSPHKVLWILLAFLIQAGYLATQIVLFSDDLHKFSPRDSVYGSIYFTLLGAHHAHVLIGLLLDLWVIARLLGGVTEYRLLTVRVVAFYWYFVAAIGVAVTLTQVSPSL